MKGLNLDLCHFANVVLDIELLQGVLIEGLVLFAHEPEEQDFIRWNQPHCKQTASDAAQTFWALSSGYL